MTRAILVIAAAILVIAAIVLWLAVAAAVTWVNAPMFLKPRARVAADLAHPGGPPLIPASGAAPDDWRRRGLPDATGRKPGPCLPAIGPETLAHLDAPPTRTDLPVPPPRNGVPLQDRPRQTVDMIICDPAVTPVVPRWYRAWLDGRWEPCPDSDTGGHYFEKKDGKWVCTLENPR